MEYAASTVSIFVAPLTRLWELTSFFVSMGYGMIPTLSVISLTSVAQLPFGQNATVPSFKYSSFISYVAESGSSLLMLYSIYTSIRSIIALKSSSFARSASPFFKLSTNASDAASLPSSLAQ